MTTTKQDDSVAPLPIYCVKDNGPQAGEGRTNKFKREWVSVIGGEREHGVPSWAASQGGGTREGVSSAKWCWVIGGGAERGWRRGDGEGERSRSNFVCV